VNGFWPNTIRTSPAPGAPIVQVASGADSSTKQVAGCALDGQGSDGIEAIFGTQIERGCAAAIRIWRANNHIRIAIAIDIAGCADGASEAGSIRASERCAPNRGQAVRGAIVDIGGVYARRADNYVGIAIAIDITCGADICAE
jgi:hypothetical protein